LNSTGLASTLSVGSTTISADYESITSNDATLTVTSAELASIAVTPNAPSVANGLSQQFIATGTYTDTSSADISNTVSWNSVDTGVASISSTGLASALSVGTTDISASLNGITSASETLTITNAELVSIAITPGTASIPQSSAQQFTATGTYTDTSTNDLSNLASWQSSNLSAATINSTGLASSGTAGSTNITAEYLGITSPSVSLTVTSAALVSIAITPDQPSINDLQTQAFTATGTYDDASTVDITNIVTWASDDTDVATISAGTGNASAVAYGTATITASLNAIDGNTDLQITISSISACGIGINDTDLSNGQGVCLKLVEGGADGPTNAAARVPPVVSTGDANDKLFTGNPSIALAEALGYSLDDSADSVGRTYARAQGATGGGTWVMFRQDGDGWQSDNNILNPPHGDGGQFDRYCKVLTELAFYGRSNWRRPTEDELLDLYYDKDLDSGNTIYDAFGWAHPRTYWTSTGSFKRINLINGQSDATPPTQSRAVSCVSENP